MRFRLILVIILSLLALPLAAQTEFGAWYVKPSVDTTNSDGARTKFKDISGYAVSVNHYWMKHLSTEFAYSVAEGDGSVSVAGAPVLNIGDLKLKALTFTAQWHLRLLRFDPYAGVGRNELCPCGSGKKFKQCHGRPGGPTGLTTRVNG